MDGEAAKLKAKINQLIDQIQLMNADIAKKNAYIQELEEEIRMLQIRANTSGANKIVNKDNEGRKSFMQDFCLIARMIFENQDFIQYNYTTANSELFYKIEKSIFDDYICKYAQSDIKTFLNFCIDLSLVKSDKNRKCTYNSGKLSVYYVSRAFVDASVGVKDMQEEVC